MLNNINFTNSIVCPFCIQKVNKMNIDNDNKTSYEFDLISCTNNICRKKFSFIICPYCNQNIYCQIKRDYIDNNEKDFKQTFMALVDGLNIKCSYYNCNKYFLLSKCPKCNIFDKYKEYIKEGKKIICKTCKYSYIQFRCPILSCKENFKRDYLNFKLFLNGIISMHNNEIFFQKLFCVECYRPIIFYNKKNKITLYIEGQKVKCPYKDCQKSFFRIICPKCYNENKLEIEFFMYGLKIKCKHCNEIFSKIMCPFCRHINLNNTKYKETSLFCCENNKCHAEFYLITCIYCLRMNIFYSDKYFQGIPIKCKYDDCHKIFNQVNCPFCKNLNIYPNGEFVYGKIYKCKYHSCQRKFTLFFCVECNILSYYKLENYEEGLIIKCNQCKKFYLNFQCPFCKKILLDKDSSYNYKYFIKCPNKECNKVFTMISCPRCNKLNYSNENQLIFGTIIHCREKSCNCYFKCVPCEKCNIFNVLIKNDNSNNDEYTQCGRCHTNYKFNSEAFKNNALKKIYTGNFTILKEIEGDIFAHGVEEIDKNYYEKEKLFLKVDEIYNKGKESSSETSIIFNKNNKTDYSSIQLSESSNYLSSYLNSSNKFNSSIRIIQNQFKNKIGECIICQNESESVFVPCGHRCTCYSCAMLYFQIYKRCPYCKENARTVIKKVYD